MPYPYEGRVAVLKAEVAATINLALITSPTTPSEATGWSSMTEASFPGYAQIPLTFGAVALDGGNYASSEATGPFSFERTSTGSPETITAVVLLIESETAQKVLDFVILDPGVVIEDAGDEIKVEKWTLKQGSPVPIS